MKIIFAGTPEFARVALDALIGAGIEVPLVLTQPDRPAGRGMKLQASPVKQCALAHGIAVAQPRSLRIDGTFAGDARAAREAIAAARADAMVVAAYGLILPQWVLDAMASRANGGAGWGCLNIHASLLPRWRGAAPIHRAIEAGDAETGVTLMQMDAGLDSGAMLRIERLPIAATDTTGRLHDRLAALGAAMTLTVLRDVQAGTARAVLQPAEGMTYAHKIDKAEAAIDWSQPAEAIDRRVRAFDPFPGATGTIEGETVKIWCCEIDSALCMSDARCGQILCTGATPESDGPGLAVRCGQGSVLRLLELQRPGGKRLAAADFLRGSPLRAGQCFDPVADMAGTAA